MVSAIVGVCLALGVVAPHETLMLPPFSPVEVVDLQAYWEDRETAIEGLTPGTEARIVWAGEVGRKAPVSVLYLHGFSATSEEIRPLPDQVAEHFGANLVFARLRGHGRDGAAMADATASQWMADTAEALAIARAVGDEVLVISMSTGAALMAIAATEPDLARDVSGIVMMSPNFHLAHPVSFALEIPGAPIWLPLLTGRTRTWAAENEDHARFWTLTYPTDAVFSMLAVMSSARDRDYTRADIPLLLMLSDGDRVVSTTKAREVLAEWAGPMTLVDIALPEAGVDPWGHVIAGDVLSPALTAPVGRHILTWADGVLPAP